MAVLFLLGFYYYLPVTASLSTSSWVWVGGCTKKRERRSHLLVPHHQILCKRPKLYFPFVQL